MLQIPNLLESWLERLFTNLMENFQKVELPRWIGIILGLNIVITDSIKLHKSLLCGIGGSCDYDE